MVKEFWLNLPVRDVTASKQFFASIGFSINTKYESGPDSACVMAGSKNFVIMLFSEKMFKGIVRHDVADPSRGSEMLTSFEVESKVEIDELAVKVKAAGGKMFGEPSLSQGWLYGCGFTDIDGHRWNALYMDRLTKS